MNQASLDCAARMARPFPPVSIGRIKRSYVADDTRLAGKASNDTPFRPVTASEELASWAARSAAANGFGDAVVEVEAEVGAEVEAGPGADRFAAEGAFAGGAAVSASLIEMTTSIVAGAKSTVGRIVDAWRRQRDQRATFNALRALDARTLRDLGIDPSELRSLAFELSGASDPARVHALAALRRLAN